MNDMRNKIFSLLVLLMTAATGAWAQGYYLVGTMNGWAPNEKYKLAANPGAEGEYMITLYLDADAEFKIVYSEDGTATTTWFPDGMGNNKIIAEEGRYTVYFRPDYHGGDDWWYNCIYAASDPLYATPTGTKNEWSFTMPDYDVELEIEYETDLTLSETTDNTATLAAWDGCDANITVQRTLQPGSWNTLVLPFDVSTLFLNILKGEGITAVKELTDATLTDGTLNLTFADATSLEAGKPYLVMVGSVFDLSTMAVPDVVKATPKPFTSTYVDFVPTLGKTLVTGPEGDESNEAAVLFLAAGNKLVNPSVVNDPENAASYIKGFRAYFRLKGNAVNAASFNLDMGDGETDGIKSVQGSGFTVNGEAYNLSGQRVGKDYKGIVIKKGKKIVVK